MFYQNGTRKESRSNYFNSYESTKFFTSILIRKQKTPYIYSFTFHINFFFCCNYRSIMIKKKPITLIHVTDLFVFIYKYFFGFNDEFKKK